MPISATNTPLAYTVYVRDDFADDWTEQTDLDVLRVEFAVAPTIPTASIQRHYGPKIESGVYSSVAALDLRGKLIRIDLADDTTTRIWYGYCPRPSDKVSGTHDDPIVPGTDRPTGTTQYQCYGNEYFLRQHLYDRCIATTGILRTAQPFNRRNHARGSQTVGYRAAATTASAVPGMDPFYAFDASSTTEWTALDAAEHLLEVFARVYGIAITLNGQHAALANVKGAWHLDSQNFHAALNALINPRVGLAWYLIDRSITVVSTSETDLAGGLIPANTNLVTLTVDQSSLLDAPVIQHVESAHYDEIEVQGSPLRVCYTMSYQYGSADKGWTSAEESTYDALTGEACDQDAQAKIYSRLVLPDAWNQESNGQNCMPVIDESDGSVDASTKQPLFTPALALDRNLPLPDAEGNPRRPLVLVKDGSTYRRVDKPGQGKERAGVRVIDDAVGIQLDAKYPHVFGLNHHSNANEKRPPIYDYQQIYATVGMPTPERVRIVVTPSSGEPGPVTKRKIIRVDDAHLWYVVPGTITDASGTGVTTHAGGYARDDRAMLQRIADLAAAWYGRLRAVVTIPYNLDALVPRLGQLITETYSGGSTTPTGTLITSEVYDVANRRTRLATEFFDLDVTAVFGQSTTGKGPQATRRIHRIEEQLPNAPVRNAVPETDNFFPVTLVEDGSGSADAGDATTQCSYTYTVKSIIGAKTLLENASPACARPAYGKLVAATKGIAYVDANDTWQLWYAHEVFDVEACS